MRRTMLVNVDPTGNHNKFYEVTLEGGILTTRWGRIPDPTKAATALGGQTKSAPGDDRAFDAAVRKKMGRGYTILPLLDSDPAKSAGREQIRTASRRGLAAEGADLGDLVDRLVDANAHDLARRSGGTIKVADGVVRTSLGVITKDTIAEARRALAALEAVRGDRSAALAGYLRLVPQKTPRKAGWADTFLSSPEDLQRQRDLLDDLEDSVDFALRQAGAADDSVDLAFRYRLRPVEDRKVLDEISALFESTKNDHHHGASKMRLVGLWAIEDAQRADEVEATLKRVGRVERMWHGTRIANLLSILATGFMVPPANAAHVTGRMFGPGIYHSLQSTKSLNYSRGMWAGTREHSSFMLLDDVAMGRRYFPKSGWDDWENAHKGGFDSINVKAGTAGVRNHEAIVGFGKGGLDQIAPRYLCEFR